ncbi:MAG: hypothetical protein NTV06_05900 [candidate division Zixibacteria bacterium]|nr:hypothetical protein [candidate division Zixibacteria bacterium]
MFDDDIVKRLESVPEASKTIKELFDHARDVSEQRVFTTIVDIECWIQDGKKQLISLPMRHWVVQQFGEYFNQVNCPIAKVLNKSKANLLRRLQMVAYSQFWECHAIQRLLTQLVRIAQGKPYDPRLLIDNRPNTSNIYKSLIAEVNRLQFMLAQSLNVIYYSQIRNAIAHSEFCVLDDYIMFFNYNSKVKEHLPSVRLQTWDKLFGITSEFIIALFETHEAYMRELKNRTPYKIELKEFGGSFSLLPPKGRSWIVCS